LAEAIESEIFTVTKPFILFHYFDGTERFPGVFPTDDVRAYEYIRYNATQFVERMGRNLGTMFDQGLYLASDPTPSHGWGHSKSWTLVEIQIPAGFRAMHASLDTGKDLPNSALKVLQDFGCRPLNFSSIFYGDSYRSNPKCLAAMQEFLHRVRLD